MFDKNNWNLLTVWFGLVSLFNGISTFHLTVCKQMSSDLFEMSYTFFLNFFYKSYIFNLYVSTGFGILILVQSAGAVEYTDYISAEG